MKKLRIEDLAFQSWRNFYKISFLVISIVTVLMFTTIDKNIRLALLILVQLVYLPFVANEFFKVFRKKKN